jgi:Asp/Glu/hydantoin racemase
MHAPRIALIHATPVAIEPIVSAFRRLWPQARTTNLLEDSLSADLAETGRLTGKMTQRFVTLSRYARDCGADAILFTCSAFGPAIEAARSALDIPVLKPNEAMLEEALTAGTHIGLIATFEPSVPSLTAELEELARSRGVQVKLKTSTVPSALAALHEGEPAEHDRLIAEAAAGMEDCEAVMLGQFSMASAADVIPERAGRIVLTSPGSAVMRLKQTLATPAPAPIAQ